MLDNTVAVRTEDVAALVAAQKRALAAGVTKANDPKAVLNDLVSSI